MSFLAGDLRSWALTEKSISKKTFNSLILERSISKTGEARLIRRKLIIKDFWARDAYKRTMSDFDHHVAKLRLKGKHIDLIYQIAFSHLTRPHFMYLDRAQCTMAVYIWTGNIPLMGNPIWRKEANLHHLNNRCPKCKGPYVHTPEHLFFHCTALNEERRFLRKTIGSLRELSVLMTKFINVATAWAIRYWEIPHFEETSQLAKYRFPLRVPRPGYEPPEWE